MSKPDKTTAPTAAFIRSLREVAPTLDSSSTSLLSAAVRLAEVGQDKEAMLMIELAKEIQGAEDQIRMHSKDAGVGLIVKLSTH